jgi:hypothetical protein
MAVSVETVTGAKPHEVRPAELAAAQRPVLFKGLAAHWPLVREGLASPAAAVAYLKRFDAGRPVVGYTGPPEIRGRFGYDVTLATLNFRAERAPLAGFLDRIVEALDDRYGPALYIGSTDLDAYLPGLSAETGLDLDRTGFGPDPPLTSIWIGNRTVAAAHYDASNNIAVCAAGRRRFTLFPPDQAANLYPGPLEPTPGGQAVSLVDDLERPDLARFPRAAVAVAAAQVAELEPGDVLVYPALWWHQVEALDAFNILINTWWTATPAWVDTPQTTLLHALLSLRGRPEHEKAGWKALFDYYVFGPQDAASAHIPAPARGDLQLDERQARRLRANLLNRLNR